MNLLNRVKNFFRKSADVFNGRVIWPGDYQRGGNFLGHEAKPFTAVLACLNIIADDISKLPIKVWQKRPDGGRDELTNHWLVRLLNKPNYFQTRTDFIRQFVLSHLSKGNTYCYFDFDGAYRAKQMFCLSPNHVAPYVTSEGDVFYNVAAQPLEFPIGEQMANMVPQRFMMHHRTTTYRNPLQGISPLAFAAVSANLGGHITEHLDSFFANMARPSGTLTTEASLTKPVIERLKEQWNEKYSGEGAGTTAVLEQGLHWEPMTVTAVDAQIIETLRFLVEDVASIFRVPTFFLGNNNIKYDSAETLIQMYYSGCLQPHIEAIEDRFNTFLSLHEKGIYVEMDIEALLRAEMTKRIEAIAKAVEKGIYAHNEARIKLGLNPIEGADIPLVQQQNVPITMTGEILQASLDTQAAMAQAANEPEVSTDDEEKILTLMRAASNG